MARRPQTRPSNRGGPTDEHGDRAELAGTTTVVGDYNYDTPTVDEIQQAETGFPDKPIPVEPVGPVEIVELPTRFGGSRFWNLDSTVNPNPQKILNADPRRAVVHLIGSGANVRLARSQNECADPMTGFLIGTNVLLSLHVTNEIWARGDAAGSRLSVLVEQWAR